MEVNNLSSEWSAEACCHGDHDASSPNLPPPISLLLSLSLWTSIGSYLTHEASGLDEHGEVQEAFLNGSDSSQGKKEYLL